MVCGPGDRPQRRSPGGEEDGLSPGRSGEGSRFLIENTGLSKLEAPPEDMTVTDDGLVVRRIRSGYSVHLLLGGVLDSYSSHLLDKWMRHDEQDGCAELVLDVGGLTFVDSSGLRTLTEAAKRAGSGGWRLRVVNARDKVRRIFDITDMDSLLDYCQRPAAGTP